MKICIDCGHYAKYNKSPVNSNYYESKMTWKLGHYIADELKKFGFEIVHTRANQEKDMEVYKRGTLAKGCKLFLSVHSNACNNSSMDNSMACCLINDNSTKIDNISVELGKKLADGVSAIMKSKKGGEIYQRVGSGGTDWYGVLRGAKSVGVPAILLEHGYHTNLQNTEWLLHDDNLKKLAEFEAKIIAEYLKIEKADNLNPETVLETSNSFKVKILDNCLNVRKTAGMNGKIVDTIKDNGVYTIIETKKINGIEWGRLKSGIGWISLHEKYTKRI